MTSLDVLKERFPGAETFRFGDSARMSAQLLALVTQGKKTATCGAARDFGEGGEALPVVGRKDIALHWDGRPAVVIETLDVTRKRFCDIDAAFALAEGENETLEGWQADHKAYFERHGGWDPQMDLICERFRVVEVVDG
ncbi:ASCH domain-containing protein [Shimia ponticola]|uniref:ASCH domain-containing protein n=1 Tax=Shimia ponticola TaxID=2582893 RepID=UPI0011BECF36|nr:ASCH domain-containing protein [Shimia ponticola]